MGEVIKNENQNVASTRMIKHSATIYLYTLSMPHPWGFMDSSSELPTYVATQVDLLHALSFHHLINTILVFSLITFSTTPSHHAS
jgi:hypothetical protein